MSGLNALTSGSSAFGFRIGDRLPIAIGNDNQSDPNRITTSQLRDQPADSTGRWMYEEAARANGFDPASVVKGSPEDQQVTATLDRTVEALRAMPKRSGVASEIEQLRGAITESAKGAQISSLNTSTIAAFAAAPGAGAFATSEAALAAERGLLRGAAQVPGLGTAALVGGSLGMAAAYVAGTVNGQGNVSTVVKAEQEGGRAYPFAGLDRVGEKRDDNVCAPQGTVGAWVVRDRGGMKADAVAYQEQIARVPSLKYGVIEYNVTDPRTGRSVDFDGCAYWSPNRELLEAKKGYEGLYEASAKYGFPIKADHGMRNQVQSQLEMAQERPLEWHFSSQRMMEQTGREMQSFVRFAPSFTVHHTPAAR